jgi:Tol biopolymer transport system component
LVLVTAAMSQGGAAEGQQAAAPDALTARLSEISQVGAFQWSPDGTQIAYLSNESGTSQIHLLTVATGATRQLTRHDHPVWDPQWSPDGTRLLFLSDPGWQERNEVWEVAVKDGKATRLLADGAVIMRNARWSPDGKTILLETNASGQFDLAVWKPDDRVLRPFIAQPASRADGQWSPDGKWVSFLSGGSVWIAGAAGEDPHAAISTGLGGSVTSARWSRDSGSIAFITDLQGNWDVGVYSVADKTWRLSRRNPGKRWTPTGRPTARNSRSSRRRTSTRSSPSSRSRPAGSTTSRSRAVSRRRPAGARPRRTSPSRSARRSSLNSSGR